MLCLRSLSMAATLGVLLAPGYTVYTNCPRSDVGIMSAVEYYTSLLVRALRKTRKAK